MCAMSASVTNKHSTECVALHAMMALQQAGNREMEASSIKSGETY